MSSNQSLFDTAYKALDSQLDGKSPTDVPALEEAVAGLYEACNPLTYDPSNPPATFTPAQYAKLFNYGYEAIVDSDGEKFYFDEDPDLEALKTRFAYLIAGPTAKSVHRSHDANQAVFSEMLNLLDRSRGSASTELALYALGVIEDALSSRNPQPAVLSDAYRAVIADIHRDFKAEGDADAAVLDRLETLLTQRTPTRLIVDTDGVARPDAGEWS